MEGISGELQENIFNQGLQTLKDGFSSAIGSIISSGIVYSFVNGLPTTILDATFMNDILKQIQNDDSPSGYYLSLFGASLNEEYVCIA